MPKKGYKQTEEHKRNTSEGLKGRTRTQKAKERISQAMLGNKNRTGYIATDKTKSRMSAAARRWHKKRRNEN